MKCPKCESKDLSIIDSRTSDEQNTIRRRRFCNECSYKFSTYEVIQGDEYDLNIDLLSHGNNFPLKIRGKGNALHKINLYKYEYDRLKVSLDLMYKVLGIKNDR